MSKSIRRRADKNGGEVLWLGESEKDKENAQQIYPTLTIAPTTKKKTSARTQSAGEAKGESARVEKPGGNEFPQEKAPISEAKETTRPSRRGRSSRSGKSQAPEATPVAPVATAATPAKEAVAVTVEPAAPKAPARPSRQGNRRRPAKKETPATQVSAEPKAPQPEVPATPEAPAPPPTIAPQAPAKPIEKPAHHTERVAAKISPPSHPAPGTPDQVIEPDEALPEVTVEELPERLRNAAANAGWKRLMPVQAKTIPYVLAGRDLMVQSRTGSGKTGAFVLPILDRVDTSSMACQALILVPTRELARQVAGEVEILGANSGVRSVAVYGGVGYGSQIDAFRQGAHVVVGTPGRVLDHLLKRSLSLDGLKILVFDEADRMLSMGFYPDMKQVKRYLPHRHVNGYMFSATFPPHVMRLAGEFLSKPEVLSLSRDHVHVAETEHVFYIVPGMDKDRALVRIIEIENPTSAIIFCNTKAKVHYVTVVLQRFGYDADELSADLSQNDRDRVLGRVREGRLRFLVATDVAARGLDIPDLSHVIQYEPPEDPEAYVHRAGRTGRAGAAGEAISLVAGIEQVELQRIAKRFTIALQRRPVPSDEDVAAVVAERITALLESRLRTRDRLQAERAQRFVALGRSLAESEDESAIIAMLLDDYYQKSLNAPVPQPPLSEPMIGAPVAAKVGPSSTPPLVTSSIAPRPAGPPAGPGAPGAPGTGRRRRRGGRRHGGGGGGGGPRE